MKICCTCKQIKPLSAFCKNRIRKDGLKNYCRICQTIHNKHYRQTKKGKITINQAKKRFHIRHPERRKAGHAVRDAIRAGRLSRPNLLLCKGCDKQAEQYYHYKGYAKKHWLDVIPVCKECHRKIDRPAFPLVGGLYAEELERN